MTKPTAIYIHIPFCTSRCGYCNFYSTTCVGQIDSYAAALCRAIETAPLDDREAVTLYLGGGTPSLMGTRLLDVLGAVRRRLPLAADAELTLEANPNTVDLPTLAALREGGYNRISFGLQAGDNGSLATLGRRHTVEQGADAVGLARRAGFENISVDLMLATPHQTVTQAQELCRYAVSLGVEHLSAYLLKIEQGTAFASSGMAQHCPDADASADIYLAACDELAAAGYRHYEVSNWARAGFESRHNSVYWQLGDYLGIGPSAFSLMNGKRFHFAPDLAGFVESPNPWSSVIYDEEGGGVDEYLLLSLRLAEGLDLSVLGSRYGIDASPIVSRAARLVTEGLLVAEKGSLRLTNRGFLVSNSVINYLLEVVC